MIPYLLEFAVIADDLTGSLDTGLQFRKKGFTTLVPLPKKKILQTSEVLVVNTNSRNLPKEVAFQRVYKACQNFKAKGIYKKIDSTMRGNVGTEALAILKAKKFPKAIIVPAVPNQARQVTKGILYVHGLPLLQTPYARDPFHPLSSSRLTHLLHKETGLPIGLITLKQVRQSPPFLAELITKKKEQILVIDAQEQTDLEMVAAAWHLLPQEVLPCGSIGLAQEIVAQIKIKKRERKKLLHFSQGPLLIISASRNPITGNQLKKVQKEFTWPIIEPDLNNLTPKKWGERDKFLKPKIIRSFARQRGNHLNNYFSGIFIGERKINS